MADEGSFEGFEGRFPCGSFRDIDSGDVHRGDICAYSRLGATILEVPRRIVGRDVADDAALLSRSRRTRFAIRVLRATLLDIVVPFGRSKPERRKTTIASLPLKRRGSDTPAN